MTRALEAGIKPAISGDTRSALIFLHGYGANGADLLGLGDVLGEHIPDTMFVAPDAPEACNGVPGGFQWFPIPWIDGSSEEELRAGLLRANDDLNAFLDGIMVDHDLLPEQVMVLGFSQGGMMTLYTLPRREDAVAGMIAISSMLIEPELLADEAQSKPPVLLVHGDQDDVVPVANLPRSAEGLQEAGWTEVYAHVMEGTGHGIAQDGLEVSLAFIRDRLGYR